MTQDRADGHRSGKPLRSHVEQKDLGVALAVEPQFTGTLDCHTIACLQQFTIELHRTSGNLNPGHPVRRQRMRDAVSVLENRRVQIHILVNRHRLVATIA